MKTGDEALNALKAVLAEQRPWHGARIGFLAQFLVALLKVRSVNLAVLATGFSGEAKVEFHYKRLQRFFRTFEVDQAALAPLLARLLRVGEGPWQLAMDRTHWRFGQTDLNFLVLGLVHRGIALPLFWMVLAKPGNSDTPERIALMERFLAVFGVGRIAPLLADRKFVGGAWFCWLQQQRIPFHQRLKRNTLVPDTDHRPVRLDALFGTLAPGQCQSLPGRRPVWGCFVHLVALRLEDGDCLFIASSGVPPAEALDADADRWQIETLFGCLKSRGFNLENTPLTDPQRLSKLMGLLALAFVWAYRAGMLLHDTQRAIPLKKLCIGPLRPSFDMASISSATSPLTSQTTSTAFSGL